MFFLATRHNSAFSLSAVHWLFIATTAASDNPFLQAILEEPWTPQPRTYPLQWLVPRNGSYPQTSIDIEVAFRRSEPELPLREIMRNVCIQICEEPDVVVEGRRLQAGLNGLECLPVGPPVCNPSLRVPIAETWAYWEDLSRKSSRSTSVQWTSIDLHSLKEELIQSPEKLQRRPDGLRSAYFEFPLPQAIAERIDRRFLPGSRQPAGLEVLWVNSAGAKSPAGTLHPRLLPKVFSPQKTTEVAMRVFFEPGWYFSTMVRGRNLGMTDLLSLKLGGCEGKPDERAIRLSSPIEVRDDLAQYKMQMDRISEVDTTGDWRRAAFLVRRSSPLSTFASTQAPSSLRGRNPNPQSSGEGLRLSICHYPAESAGRGEVVGVAEFALASSDAAEFVAISIFILLGIPSSCMWTLGCLAFKHRKLRNELRFVRLGQQRDEVEKRLCHYLGFRR